MTGELSTAPRQELLPRWLFDWLLTSLFAIAVAVNLVAIREPGFASNDSAQYLDVAHNLASGHGAVTRIAYYEAHHAYGAFPIPQTVFAPGYSALVALGILAGMSAFDAAFFVALAAHVAAAALLLATLRMCSSSRFMSVGAAIVWLSLAAAQLNVLALLSDVVYTSATLASLYFVCRWAQAGGLSRRPLMWCGLLAGLAFTVRYAGVFFCLALGLYFGSRALWARRRREFLEAASVLAPAALVAGAVLLRNLLVAGDSLGNPGVSRDPVLGDVVRYAYLSLGQLLGVSWSDVLSGTAPDVLVPLGVGAGALMLASTRPPSGEPLPTGRERVTRTALSLAAVYVAVTIGALSYLALVRSADLVSARYLLPVVPFLLLLAVGAVDGILRRRPVPAARRAIGIGLIMVGVLLGQWNIRDDYVELLRADPTYAILEEAFVGDATSRAALDRIRATSGPDAPKLMLESQLGSLLLDFPLVGVTDERYVRAPWTLGRLRTLLETFKVTHVFVLPRLPMDPGVEDSPLEAFFIDLAGGRSPAWLELEFSNSVLLIYRVAPQDEAGA